MAIFLRKLGFLTILLLGYLAVLQIIISIRVNGKTINGQDNLEQCHNKNADIVFLGNSRCITTFMPSIFNAKGLKAVNLGLHGHPSVRFAKLRLENYIKRNSVNPKVVIINLDAFSAVYNEPSLIMKDRFARYAFLPEKMNRELLTYFNFNFLDTYVPSFALLKYRKIWDALLLNNVSQWPEIGMETETTEICSSLNKLKSRALMKEYRNKKMDPTLIKELDEFNKELASKQIQLIAVQVPVYETIYNSRFIDTRQICDRSSTTFIDFAIPKFNSDCSIFKDLNHMNTKGARIISDSLSKFILQ
jgi:hypothetical protein